MKNLSFLALLAAAFLSQTSNAQVSSVPKIGFLGNSTAALEKNLTDAFRQGLRTHGYEEGRNIIVVYRWAEGRYSHFPKLVAELLDEKVDVLVTAGTPASLAIKKASQAIPTVMIAVGDPVGTGLVLGLSRPGGNLTGLSSIAPDLEGKRLELLREIIPNLSRVAMFINSSNPFHKGSVSQARAAAEKLGITLQVLDVRSSNDLDSAFSSIQEKRPEALLFLADRVFLHERTRIAGFATQHNLPSISAYRELVDAGGLISFGPSYEEMHKRAATYVHKILQGAKPAELPIEQPSKFTLVLNIKAAKELNLDLSAFLISRADELIE